MYRVPCRYLLRVDITSLILTVPLGGPYFEQYIIFCVCVCKFVIVYILLLFGEYLLYVIITSYEQPFEQGSVFLIIRGVRAARSYHFRVVPENSAGQ